MILVSRFCFSIDSFSVSISIYLFIYIFIGNLLERVLLLCKDHNVKMDAKFVQIICGIGILEGLIKRLDPTLDIMSLALPYIVQAAVRDKQKYYFGKSK